MVSVVTGSMVNNLLGTEDAIPPNKWGFRRSQHLEDCVCEDTPKLAERPYSGAPAGWRVRQTDRQTDRPTDRRSPVVSAVKPNGKVCIYVDLKMHSTRY